MIRTDNAVDRLNAEWSVLSADASNGTTVIGWLIDAGVFAPDEAPSDLTALLRELKRRDLRLGRKHTDRWMGALLHHAIGPGETGQLATRVVMQAMLAGACSTASRMQRGDRPYPEVIHIVVTALFEVVRQYPLHRRPAKIAANLLMDTVRISHRELQGDAPWLPFADRAPLDDARHVSGATDQEPEEWAVRMELAAAAAVSGLPGLACAPEDLVGSRGEVIGLLVWALSERAVDTAGVMAVTDHYQEAAVPDELAARRAGVRPAAWRKRRSRVVNQLRQVSESWLEQTA
ncbi:hypothetical protein [Streptomyces sp. RKAG293]|uniref:hypothetical protein n=1 Tax=Streptomyces sp. RKAG293 TaxID=2893403 RepID=UPI0020333B4F|nr:hypothetical protein [Streptomyces sp. RKAG293]MCM2424151.1 hypothetical protein [Streptomyces sp. RKAG293]